ncbi:hypothetical protein M5689_025453 [Euphorbia peplus]|nr:hypothetical protein M5689_025453 [Euphorbia peplus]
MCIQTPNWSQVRSLVIIRLAMRIMILYLAKGQLLIQGLKNKDVIFHIQLVSRKENEEANALATLSVGEQNYKLDIRFEHALSPTITEEGGHDGQHSGHPTPWLTVIPIVGEQYLAN